MHLLACCSLFGKSNHNASLPWLIREMNNINNILLRLNNCIKPADSTLFLMTRDTLIGKLDTIVNYSDRTPDACNTCVNTLRLYARDLKEIISQVNEPYTGFFANERNLKNQSEGRYSFLKHYIMDYRLLFIKLQSELRSCEETTEVKDTVHFIVWGEAKDRQAYGLSTSWRLPNVFNNTQAEYIINLGVMNNEIDGGLQGKIAIGRIIEQYAISFGIDVPFNSPLMRINWDGTFTTWLRGFNLGIGYSAMNGLYGKIGYTMYLLALP